MGLVRQANEVSEVLLGHEYESPRADILCADFREAFADKTKLYDIIDLQEREDVMH